VFVNGGKN